MTPARIERAAVMVAAYAFARQSVRDSAMGDAGMLALADAFAALQGRLRSAGPQLKTVGGRLTRYALACGYIETFKAGEFSAQLDMPSPSAGVLRVFAQNDAWRILYSGRSLTAARRAFDEYKRTAAAACGVQP